MDVFQKLRKAVKMTLAARKTQKVDNVDRQVKNVMATRNGKSPQLNKFKKKFYGYNSDKNSKNALRFHSNY